MRSASPALIALINGSTEFRVADLLTILPVSGSAIRLTSADFDITAVSRVDNASHTFLSSGPRFKRGQTKLVVGLEVDALQLSIYPANATDQLNGTLWPAAVRAGYLDGAFVCVERAFMPSWGDTTAGTVIMFGPGRVGKASPLRNSIELEVKSDLELLNQTQFPINVFSPGCLHTLFDAGCGLSKAAFTTSATTAGGSTAAAINATIAQATGYYDLGVITYTSGQNAGVARSIRTWVAGSPGVLSLMRPFPYVPAPGDAFTVTPGCDKVITPSPPSIHAGDINFGTCAVKFNNVVNARAFPYVPTPENSL